MVNTDLELAENKLRTWKLRWEGKNKSNKGESAEDETVDES